MVLAVVVALPFRLLKFPIDLERGVFHEKLPRGMKYSEGAACVKGR